MYLHGGDIYRNVGVIDFSANINFLGMPESVRKAAHKGVDLSIHYPQMQNIGLVEEIAGYYSENGMIQGWNEQNYVCGNGAAEVIFSFMNVLNPKKALLTAPTFHEYGQALTARVTDCKIRKYVLLKDNSLDITTNILKYITDDIELVCICNPNNPTGRLAEKALILQVLEACKGVGAWLFVDESFMEFAEGYKAYSICNGLQDIKYDKVFVLKSFTKLFAMPGLRLGYGISPNTALIRKMKDSLQPWNISLPAQCAGMAAVQEMRAQKFDRYSRKKVAEERNFLYKELTELGYTQKGLKVYEGFANFLLLELQREPWEGWLFEKCLAQGILIRNCSNFDGLGTGWYRVAVRGREENRKLVEAIRRSFM